MFLGEFLPLAFPGIEFVKEFVDPAQPLGLCLLLFDVLCGLIEKSHALLPFEPGFAHCEP